jgi:hypothetical protein
VCENNSHLAGENPAVGCFQKKQDTKERTGEKFPGFFDNKNSVEKYLGKIFLLAVLFYISVRLFLFHIYPAPLPAGDAALLPESDARSYLLLSKLPLLSKALLFGGRPPGYPVFLKIFSGNLNFIYSTQFVISSVSAVLFMRIMYRLIKNSYLKILTLIGLVIFFLNPNLMIWDKWVIAESLTFSIFFILFSLLLATAQKPRIYDLLFIAALWICWGSLRDGNIYLLLFFCIYILFAAVVKLLEKKYVLICIPLMIFFLYSNYAIHENHRNWLSLTNVITLRVLNDRDRLEYFEKHGMPVDHDVMQRKGRVATDDFDEFFRNIGLQNFRKWLFKDGKKTYEKYLLTHLGYLSLEPFRYNPSASGKIHRSISDLSIKELFETRIEEGYLLETIPTSIRRWLWPVINFYFGIGIYFLAVIFMIKGAVWKPAKVKKEMNFILFFIVFSYPFMLVLWHGDSCDVWRHLLPALTEFNLGAMLFICFLLDEFLTSNKAMNKEEIDH